MAKKIEILFNNTEGFCYGCKSQGASTSSTLQIIGMVLTLNDNGKSLSQTYCYSCAIKRIEGLKKELLDSKNQ